MKRLFDTKIQRKLIFSLILALSLSVAPAFAQTTSVDQLNTQKSDTQKKLDAINAQIKAYQQQIAATQAKSSSLKNEISIYDKQIASLDLQIQAKQTQIEDTQLQITETQKLIDQKTQEIDQNKEILGELIVQLHQYDDQYLLQTTLGSKNLSDFLDQVQNTASFQDKIYQVLQKIQQLKASLEKEKSNLQAQLNNLQQLQKQLQYTQEAMATQRSQKQALLTQTKGIEKNFQALLTQSKDQEQKLEKEVEDLDAQIRAKLGKKAAPGGKGILAWPLDGILTQGYGNTGFTSLGYNFHNGIDIAAPAATPIYAAADGTVYDVDHSDQSFGNWVAIKHTLSNGRQIITLYGHMRSFIVSPGQQVKEGDLIGYEGNTGNTTKKLYGPERGYHLHFGVYDMDGFGVQQGAYTKIYGPYKVPFGYTYDPRNFLP